MLAACSNSQQCNQESYKFRRCNSLTCTSLGVDRLAFCNQKGLHGDWCLTKRQEWSYIVFTIGTSDRGRLWVRLISKQAFRDYMEYRGQTNEMLADKARCSESTIAFLRSTGKSARDTVGPETARRIEKALNAPPGSLFSATILVASPSGKRSA